MRKEASPKAQPPVAEAPLQTKAPEKPSQSRRSGVSEVTADPASGLVLVRGWISDTTDIGMISIFGPKDSKLGDAKLTIRRADIAAAHGQDPGDKNGFAATLDAALAENDKVLVQFLNGDGAILAEARGKAKLGSVTRREPRRGAATSVVAAENPQQSRQFAISEAVLIGRDHDLFVRGWVSNPDEVLAIRLRIGNQTVGLTRPGVARPDVAARLGLPATAAIGFVFAAEARAAKVGGVLEAEFMGQDGNQLFKAGCPIVQQDRLTDLLFAYDFESRQLRIQGCIFPKKHLRGISILFPKGRMHQIRHIFEYRPLEAQKDPFSSRPYSGFSDRIMHVGEGDMRGAKLDLLYTDGDHHRWEIPADAISMDVPEAAIEKVAIDWEQGEISVRGWMRSREAVTGIEVFLNGQQVFGIPLIVPSERIQKLYGFRGRPAQEFKFSGKLAALLDDPNALFEVDVKTTLRLLERGRPFHEVSQQEVATEVTLGRITLAQFDRRSNVMHVSGQIASPVTPVSAQLLVNDAPIDGPLPLQISDRNQSGHFSWTHEINAAMPANSTIKLRFEDDAGAKLGTLRNTAKPLIVVGKGAIEAGSQEEMANLLLQPCLQSARLPGPSVCFVIQGRLDGGATGGGLLRLLDLMQSFHDAGYATVLIDRSEPWETIRSAEAYRKLRAICDLHLQLPASLKQRMAEILAKQIEEDPRLVPAEFKVRGKSFPDVLRAAGSASKDSLERGGLSGRVDVPFLTVAAALVNILMPKIVITSYAWSGPMHDLLRPGILGMIDTIDVQALRATVFQKAFEDFGPEAVPDPAKFDVNSEEEMQMLSKAGAIIAISRDEHAYLVSHFNPAKVVLAGVSARAANPLPPTAPGCRQVLFVGNLYEPNSDGIRKFILEQWPRVLSKVPDAKLVIAGRVCEAVSDLAEESIEVLGVVDDLRPIYEASAVALNPIRFGTGSSVKLIETLSLGRAIVTTEIGARGFEGSEGTPAMHIADIDGFAEAVTRLLLNDKDRWATEAEAAAYADAHLSPGQTHADLFNLVESKLFYS